MITRSIIKSFNIDLDLKRSSVNESFEVVDGDTGNTIIITLTDDGQAVKLDSHRVVAIFSNSAGTFLQDSGDIDGGITINGNIISIELFPSSFSPGLVECELQIYTDRKTAVTDETDAEYAEYADTQSTDTESTDMQSADTENTDTKSADTENTDTKSADTENTVTDTPRSTIFDASLYTNLVTSTKFNFFCRRSLLNEQTIQSVSEYPMLMAIINDISEAENARSSNESRRQSNEAVRQANEQNRIKAENTRNSNESTRVASENTRITTEEARAKAESARVTAENARATKEESRAKAESARVTAENARVTAENARVTKEESRAKAESARVAAETLRASAESQRDYDEDTRLINEITRMESEAQRDASETARAKAEITRNTAESARTLAEIRREEAERVRRLIIRGSLTDATETDYVNDSINNAIENGWYEHQGGILLVNRKDTAIRQVLIDTDGSMRCRTGKTDGSTADWRTWERLNAVSASDIEAIVSEYLSQHPGNQGGGSGELSWSLLNTYDFDQSVKSMRIENLENLKALYFMCKGIKNDSTTASAMSISINNRMIAQHAIPIAASNAASATYSYVTAKFDGLIWDIRKSSGAVDSTNVVLNSVNAQYPYNHVADIGKCTVLEIIPPLEQYAATSGKITIYGGK